MKLFLFSAVAYFVSVAYAEVPVPMETRLPADDCNAKEVAQCVGQSTVGCVYDSSIKKSTCVDRADDKAEFHCVSEEAKCQCAGKVNLSGCTRNGKPILGCYSRPGDMFLRCQSFYVFTGNDPTYQGYEWTFTVPGPCRNFQNEGGNGFANMCDQKAPSVKPEKELCANVKPFGNTLNCFHQEL